MTSESADLLNDDAESFRDSDPKSDYLSVLVVIVLGIGVVVSALVAGHAHCSVTWWVSSTKIYITPNQTNYILSNALV